MPLPPIDPAVLSEMPLFEGLPARELERLAPLMRERVFPSGVSVLMAGQPGETVYVLLGGSVKVHLVTPDGAEVILAVLGAGEAVGEMSLADSLGRSASVTTLEETSLLWMDRRTFRSSVEGSSVLARNLVGILSRRVRLANAHLLSMAASTCPDVSPPRSCLSRGYGEQTPEGVRIPQRLTQADLAALAGASRVRVNQALGYPRKRNEISVGEDGRIAVHDEEALARRAR